MLESIKARPATPKARPRAHQFRDDLLQGLRATPKTIPGHHRIDARGSALMEMILATYDQAPERWELELLQEHGQEIAQIAGPGVDVVEIGGMTGARARRIVSKLESPRSYLPVGPGHEGISAAARALAREFPGLSVIPLQTDSARLTRLPEAVRDGPCTLFFIPGAVFSSMPPREAIRLCQRLASLAERPHFLVGAGLKKDVATLEAAYDDPAGYVAAFNLNVLARANRELEGDFDLTRYKHRARWNEDEGYIELSLESVGAQTVHFGQDQVRFAAREPVLIDRIYKLTPNELSGYARQGGFLPLCNWVDDGGNYSLQLFVRSAAFPISTLDDSLPS